MRILKTFAILAIGWGIIAFGAVLIPLPGPGILIVVCGIVVLSLKSSKARWVLSRFRTYLYSKWPGGSARLERFRAQISRWTKR